MVKCPNCGKQIAIEDASFCPYCGKPLKALEKRTPFPITAGVLTIIAACIAITIGIIYIAAAVYSYTYGYELQLNVFYLIAGILGIIAFAFGLIGGIFSLRRRRMGFSIFGMSLLIASGVAMVLASGVFMSIAFGVYALPTIILSILGVIFVAISKGEFA